MGQNSQNAPIVLRSPDAGECDYLTELCLRSKAVWGYDAGFIANCREELTINAADIASDNIMVAEQAGTVIALAQIEEDAQDCYLDKLFVDPDSMHNGAGKALFLWAVKQAQSKGFGELIIESDPGAAQFYLKMGAIEAGEAPSQSIAGRILPRLTVQL